MLFVVPQAENPDSIWANFEENGIVYFALNKAMKGKLHARGRLISTPARNSSWDSSAFGSWSISDARFSASLSQA
jgi:hypothetical protein